MISDQMTGTPSYNLKERLNAWFRLCTLAASVLVTLSGCETQQPSGKTIERRRARAVEATPPPKPPSPEAMAARNRLITEYEQILANAFPAYNGIKVENNLGTGYLLASHPLFTGYEFDVGPFARVLSAWVAANTPELTKAGINLIGIKTPSGVPRTFYTGIRLE